MTAEPGSPLYQLRQLYNQGQKAPEDLVQQAANYTFTGTSPAAGGLAPTNYSSQYGGIPTIPSPTATAGTAITGNLANLSSLYQLATGLNPSAPAQQTGIATATANANEMLNGQLPKDVVNQILQGAAERGISTGTGGSSNSNAAYLRALGLNSLGMMQQGQNNLKDVLSMNIYTPLGLDKMLVTPEQEQEAQTAQSIYRAAPNPYIAALNAQNTVQQGITSVTNPPRTTTNTGGVTYGSSYRPFGAF